ncbi:uncharacterized protein MELLADRAFT_85843 [Melampsora larici-populina 98AG31]|uniref:Uncharacterized protein n=1 Tax=Melampsora larici-populina (strain 98AG31 / pathotype 3-4-7) TaxID=747676 RepID=F4RJZ4_MELLP|nr:uncharacterized protein MELLADRAFT_85843 [Melampsora larici-populina 98AG31]EGG07399.1 hypothetical protein MELLADRAFT_85843 [Melampsora larici-populina 98AG31]
MLEPTIRGNLDAVLDPDNPPVNKQIMLDWLRINHPKTVVRSKANKDKVADIVRSVQPHIFHDSASNALANTSASPDAYPTLEHLQVTSPVVINSFKAKAQSKNSSASQRLEVPDLSNASTKVADPLPALEKLRVLSPDVSKSSKEQLPKRLASQDLEVPYPTKRLGISETDAKTIKVKIEAKATSNASNSKTKKYDDKLTNYKQNHQRPKRLDQQSEKSLNGHMRHELETLKQSIYAPPHDASKELTTATSVVPELNPATHHNDNVDLIEFSDTEIFEVGNLVFGRDIPSINMHADLSKPKTGVDVIQEEQRREEKVQSLEERLASLESSLVIAEQKASNRLFQDLQQEQVNADLVGCSSFCD